MVRRVERGPGYRPETIGAAQRELAAAVAADALPAFDPAVCAWDRRWLWDDLAAAM